MVMLSFLMKFFSVFYIIFFTYVFYLSLGERKQFFKSEEYNTASMFEKIVLNTVSIFGFSFYVLILISSIVFIISSVVIKTPF